MKKLLFVVPVLMLFSITSCDSDKIFDEVEQLAIDIELIDAFLAENNLVAEVDEDSGLRYIVHQEGAGANADFGATVIVEYTGTLLDGTQFDASIAPDHFDLVIGRGDVIQGWDIAIRKFNAGTRATLYIPSRLGYGNARQGFLIPPNSVLIFDITVLDIRQ